VATFIESSVFARLRPAYPDDDEYAALQQHLLAEPSAGPVVPGSGGVRKLRWARPGMGKRGGFRVIYFVQYEPMEFWMLTVYSKSREANVPGHVLRKLVEAFRDD
jgi:hypothetical protein